MAVVLKSLATGLQIGVKLKMIAAACSSSAGRSQTA
jgi:hypothetical protein